jgi:hypothetical protein
MSEPVSDAPRRSLRAVTVVSDWIEDRICRLTGRPARIYSALYGYFTADEVDRAEDGATLGSVPSADPGAKTDGRGGRETALPAAIRIGTNATNPPCDDGDGLPRASSAERRVSNSC